VLVGRLVGWLTQDVVGAHTLVPSRVCVGWLVGWLTRPGRCGCTYARAIPRVCEYVCMYVSILYVCMYWPWDCLRVVPRVITLMAHVLPGR
jgi:hypothetical protein